MARISRPKHGNNYRITGKGYIDGVFIINGRRTFRALGKLAAISQAPSGKKRSPKQLVTFIQRLWDEKLVELSKHPKLKSGIERPIGDVMLEWITKAPDNGIARTTVENHYIRLRNQYLDGVGDHPLGEFSLEHIDRLKSYLSRELGQRPTTINMRLVRLKGFLNWAKARDYLNGFPRIEKLKVKKRIPRAPQIDQIKTIVRRVLELATTHPVEKDRYYCELHWMELLFVLGSGVRRAGPLYTPWKNVYFDQSAILMPKSKGGEELVFLPLITINYLRNRRARYPHHVWLFDNGQGDLAYKDPHSLTTAFRRLKLRLGYGEFEFKPIHGFRANFATVNLNELGLDSRTVSKLLDHSSFKTTEDAYLVDRAIEQRRALKVYEKDYLSGLFERNLIETSFPITEDTEIIKLSS